MYRESKIMHFFDVKTYRININTRYKTLKRFFSKTDEFVDIATCSKDSNNLASSDWVSVKKLPVLFILP